jgi:DNA-binding MarR family transcriptional regulator
MEKANSSREEPKGPGRLCKRSTVTRFIDTLVYKGYLIRKSKGKASKVYSTAKGEHLKEPINAAWKSLYHRYSRILGMKKGEKLTRQIDGAGQKLEERP